MQDASSLRIEQNLRYFLQNDESLRKLVENIFLAEEESRMQLSIDDVLEFIEEMAELVGGAPVLSKHIVEKIYVEALYMEKSGANRWAQNTGIYHTQRCTLPVNTLPTNIELLRITTIYQTLV